MTTQQTATATTLPREFAIGSTVTLICPFVNYLGVDPAWTTRRLTLESIIDRTKHPIPARAVAKYPLRRRGRWLLVGTDRDRGHRNSIYLECCFHHWRYTSFELGLFDPRDPDREILARRGPFVPTPRAMHSLARLIRDYKRHAAFRRLPLSMGVFAIDQGNP
jgi:hypothetical protein